MFGAWIEQYQASEAVIGNIVVLDTPASRKIYGGGEAVEPVARHSGLYRPTLLTLIKFEKHPPKSRQGFNKWTTKPQCP